jgi:hypothetical protein
MDHIEVAAAADDGRQAFSETVGVAWFLQVESPDHSRQLDRVEVAVMQAGRLIASYFAEFAMIFQVSSDSLTVNALVPVPNLAFLPPTHAVATLTELTRTRTAYAT